jgi:hypothetical protein
MDPFLTLIAALATRDVRYLMIDVWAANLYAKSAGQLFTTEDRDFLLPPDAANLHRAWTACEAAGFTLSVGREPLDVPRDLELARRIVDRRALVRGHHESGLDIDLTLVMTGFSFDDVWKDRRTFRIEHETVAVARLGHIIQSKAAAGRDKDRLFLATHAELLRSLIEND